MNELNIIPVLSFGMPVNACVSAKFHPLPVHKRGLPIYKWALQNANFHLGFFLSCLQLGNILSLPKF
jgi:hypothetical protein